MVICKSLYGNDEYEVALRTALSELKTELKMEKEHNVELTKNVNKLKMSIEHNKGTLEKSESVFKQQIVHQKKSVEKLREAITACNASFQAQTDDIRKTTIELDSLKSELDKLKFQNSILEEELLKYTTRKRFFLF